MSSMDTNSVTVEGRIGDEVEVKYTQKGTPWTKLSIANSGKFGEKEWTNWFKVECWGELAEQCGTFAKGAKVLVQGKLKNNMWESKDGGKRKETVVKADGVYLAPDNRVSGLHVIKEPAQGFLEAPPDNKRINFANDDDIPF